MQVTTIGIDVAKSVFQLHVMDSRGRVVLRKRLPREKLLADVANLPRCVIGMEACASAHQWAREIEKLGHEVKLIYPRFVKAYCQKQ
jgi:transposase